MITSLDIIIVNWNAGDLLVNCLSSIQHARCDNFSLDRVVIVDNDSTDGTIRNLSCFSLPVTIIQNRSNLGFARACNQGAQNSHADYLLFLNPDTRLMGDSLVSPIAFMQDPENASVGICGIQLLDDEGLISRTCANFPKPFMFYVNMFGLNRILPNTFPTHFMLEWDHNDNREVDQLMGAFFLVRRELFNKLKGFDERFFVYFEEVDFSLRAKEAGWKSVYLGEAKAFHKGGGSSEQIKATRLFYSLRSRIFYAYKHFGYLSATLLLVSTLMMEPLSRIMLGIINKSTRDIYDIIVAYSMLWSSIPDIYLWKSHLKN